MNTFSSIGVVGSYTTFRIFKERAMLLAMHVL